MMLSVTEQHIELLTKEISQLLVCALVNDDRSTRRDDDAAYNAMRYRSRAKALIERLNWLETDFENATTSPGAVGEDNNIAIEKTEVSFRCIPIW